MSEERRQGLRILIAGTGGQGVLTTARMLAELFLKKNREVVSGQLHGMAQRGGSVSASVIVSVPAGAAGVSPVIPAGGADLVLGLEPVETTRALDRMSARSEVLMNTAPVYPYVLSQRHVLKKGGDRYPELSALTSAITAVTPRLRTLDVSALTADINAPKALGTLMLGWAIGLGLLPATPEEFVELVLKKAPLKIRKTSAIAFSLGVEAAHSSTAKAKAPA